ncbi:MAG: hypothetical protein JWL67_2104 [Solirubrobacterales bacterium]|nr:hypothetical protein [Solirubrobacterales bacterium]
MTQATARHTEGMDRMRTERKLERAIVLELLRDDHEPPWSIEDLGGELGTERDSLKRALGRLGSEGVVLLRDGQVSAASATRRLEDLGLIAI